MSGRIHLHRPQLFAGSRIERPESRVRCRADKDQVARGGNAAACVRRASLQALGGEFVEDPQGRAPGNVSGVGVDGD